MKFSAILAVALASVVAATPLNRREVPQEHSHDLIVDEVRKLVQGSKEPIAKLDVVFGKLGDTAINNGIAGAGLQGAKINPACVQLNLADVCVTQAKGDKNKIALCLQYRVLERNTGKVGQASAACNEKPKNAILNGLVQLQDPASADGKANNGKIQTDLAKALVKTGFSANEAADLALQTSTFGAGNTGDNSGKGNACDGFDKANTVHKQAAPKDFDFFGRAIKKGQQVDCITFQTITGGQSKAVPSIQKADLLKALGGAGGNGGGKGGNGGKGGKNLKGDNKGAAADNKGAAADNGAAAGGEDKVAEAAQLLKQAIDLLNSA
ncbi:hypothetical protein HDU97_000114 [Phlyctochytrium planicorne]|nr:hypothetical protein HDU97_000114 [Phlyctochytrium planicorne]